jgi:hypothetical protein
VETETRLSVLQGKKILPQIQRHVLQCWCEPCHKIRGKPAEKLGFAGIGARAAERPKLAVDSVHSATENHQAPAREEDCNYYQLTLPWDLRSMGHAQYQPATLCFRCS